VLLTRTPLYSWLPTFPFDLHVLGAPPALILSRDQTLIGKCRVCTSLRFTQSSDESFLTASNQIVNDLRNPPCIRMKQEKVAGLETCSGARHRQRRVLLSGKLAEIKKEPNRKAVAAPCGGPHEVLLPFLAEDLRFLYHNRAPFSKSPPFGAQNLRASIGDLPRIANAGGLRKSHANEIFGSSR
jgi:hypothetical protein